MLPALTTAERRGALTVVLLLVLGAGHDLWQARHPQWTPRLPPPVMREALHEPGPAPAETPGAAVLASSVLDLNRATASELDALPGIGPVLAARIVAERARRGGFRAPEDLLAVQGIGPRLYARLKPRVRIGP